MIPVHAVAGRSTKSAVENSIRKRVSAVIVKDNKVLLIERIKPKLDYFVFPGGGVENESLDEALKREVKEELSLKIKEWRLLFKIKNQREGAYNNMHDGNQEEHYFLIEDYNGIPEISGPEKERMNERNQYCLKWIRLSEIKEMPNVYPLEAAKRLLELLW